MTKEAQSAMLRSPVPRADQWCAGSASMAMASDIAMRSPQSMTDILASGAARRMIVSLPSGVTKCGRWAACSRFSVTTSRWS